MIQENSFDKEEAVLKASDISISFPGVKALSNVNFMVKRGEVVALLGENGAGKSTLIKILSGVYQCDEGYVELEGERRKFEFPMEAKAAGIGVVHQELNYVSTISIAENIYMGNIPKKGIFVDQAKLESGAKEFLTRVGLTIDPRTLMSRCSVAQKQLIEIAKVMADNVKVLILDEPTSSLNDVETENLFRLIDSTSSVGVSIIYISHKLDEIFRVADRVVVLRDGAVTGQVDIRDATKEKLISLMVGRDLSVMYPKKEKVEGDIALEVNNLTNEILKGVNFAAHKGTIFGIYGLLGSGHLEIGPTLFGQMGYSGGEIKINGEKVVVKNPLTAMESGISYVPAERKVDGLILNASVKNNIIVAYYSTHPKVKLINNETEKRTAKKWIENLKIKTPSQNTSSESLSGGNQQKVVLARWLELEPDILILNEPTRGIDVGAKAEIYRILEDLCDMGKCVIMVTSEMPELLNMSDEIMVMFEGRVTGIMNAKEATQEKVIQLAIGS